MSKEERFKIFIAVYLILVKDGEILFSKRANTGYMDGGFSLVSGHLDGAETAKQGIIREAHEEAGIVMEEKDLNVVHVMHRYRPEREYIDIYLKAENWEGEVSNMEPDKCSDLKWFSLDKLPENILPEVKSAIESSEKNDFYGEIGWDKK